MRGFPHHLLSLLLVGLIAMGAVGLRSAHIAGGTHACAGTAHPRVVCAGHGAPRSACHGTPPAAPQAPSPTAPQGDDHPCSPAPQQPCAACEQIDALVGTLLSLEGVFAFHALVAVEPARAPRTPAAPLPPRVAGARPPPCC